MRNNHTYPCKQSDGGSDWRGGRTEEEIKRREEKKGGR